MARIIINEGTGPRDVPLSGVVVLGSNPSCDVVLEHDSAIGCRVELKPLRWGYRAQCVKGEMLVNEEPAEMADLEHNDTLRVGDVMVLYKQPESAEEFAAGAVAAPATAEPAPEEESATAEVASEEEPAAAVGSLEEELDALSLEADDDTLDLEGFDLDEAATSEDDPFAELEPESGLFEELAPEPAEPEPAPSEDVSAEFDLTIQRARWKRLEALRRLRLVREGSDEIFIDISKPKALEEVAALDEKGEVADLEAYEDEQGLTEKTVAELLAMGEEACAAREAAAEPLEPLEDEEPEPEDVEEPLEELEVDDEAEPALAGGDAELEELEVEADETQELSEPAVATETTPRAPMESVVEPPSTDGDEYELPPVAAAASSASVAGGQDLDAVEDLEELSDLDELESVDEPEESFELEPVAATEPAMAAASAPAAAVPPPVLGTRPLPPGGVRFRRPLPPGFAAPTYLPPVHPGAPPA